MTVLHPCHRCHRREGCQIQIDLRAKLRGTGVTLANHRCKIPQQDFPVGARVSVQTFEMEEVGWGEEEIYRKSACTVTGTIVAWRDRKALVVIDKTSEIRKPDGDSIAHVRALPDRLTRLEEPMVELCQCGGLPKSRCEARDFPTLNSGKTWFCNVVEATRVHEEFVY